MSIKDVWCLIHLFRRIFLEYHFIYILTQYSLLKIHIHSNPKIVGFKTALSQTTGCPWLMSHAWLVTPETNKDSSSVANGECWVLHILLNTQGWVTVWSSFLGKRSLTLFFTAFYRKSGRTEQWAPWVAWGASGGSTPRFRWSKEGRIYPQKFCLISPLHLALAG